MKRATQNCNFKEKLFKPDNCISERKLLLYRHCTHMKGMWGMCTFNWILYLFKKSSISRVYIDVSTIVSEKNTVLVTGQLQMFRGFLSERDTASRKSPNMKSFKNKFYFVRQTNSLERKTQSIHCNARRSGKHIKTNTERNTQIQFSGNSVEGKLGKPEKKSRGPKKWSESLRSKLVLEVWDVLGSTTNHWTLSFYSLCFLALAKFGPRLPRHCIGRFRKLWFPRHG